jgi:hypothetical protein
MHLEHTCPDTNYVMAVLGFSSGDQQQFAHIQDHPNPLHHSFGPCQTFTAAISTALTPPKLHPSLGPLPSLTLYSERRITSDNTEHH